MLASIKRTVVIALTGSFALLVSVMPSSVFAMEWQVDEAASKIAFSGTHAGRAFEGQFNEWSADIRFDPDALDQSSVTVTVQTNSAETGTRLYDRTLPNDEWFNVAAHPDAVFAADEFSQLDDGRYQARGTLTIKGNTQPIILPFNLSIDGQTATVAGVVELDRIALDMGVKSDPDAAWVSQVIPVTITLVATRP